MSLKTDFNFDAKKSVYNCMSKVNVFLSELDYLNQPDKYCLKYLWQYSPISLSSVLEMTSFK